METYLRNESTDPDKTDVNTDLSSHLYRVLDVVGVSEEAREGYGEAATIWEILNTAIHTRTDDCNFSRYVFGSRYEGTTTRGLKSDTDSLLCHERLPVVEKIEDAPVDGPAFLMLSDDTKPGYVKLQTVVNRIKETINEREVTHEEDTDHQGRIVVKHMHDTLPNIVRHGPADTHLAREGEGESDLVYAYRCRTIPSFANEWLLRPRAYQWPSEEQLQRMGSYGCFLVGVSHPDSENKETEWRISFSLQERDLMTSLNPTQHKCYVLLKMLKKDIIQQKIGKSLSSYHCKTCIFYLIESCGIEQWTPTYLVPCLLECLRLLRNWVRQENCPNYFIREENMFDKLDKSTLTRLSLVLQEILSSGVQFLYEINCDDLGTLLTWCKSCRYLKKRERKVKRHYKFVLYMQVALVLLDARNELYSRLNNAATSSERVSRAEHILQYLERTTTVTEHKPRDVRMALDRLIPYMQFVIHQMKCSDTLYQLKWDKENNKMQSLARETKLFNNSDLIWSRLLVASLCLHCNELDSCQEILYNCVISLEKYVISTCQCYSYKQYRNKHLQKKIVDENLSFNEIPTEYTAACMIFLPSEANLVPAALRYEMYRSVYTPPGSRRGIEDEHGHLFDWFDWIVVDSKVYLYFLQYILYDKTNKPVFKQDSIDNIKLLINNKYENLGHRETALNLLGWIYIQENRVQEAFVCFRRSLAIRSLHNAAKWHMAVLLHSLITPQTIYKK